MNKILERIKAWDDVDWFVALYGLLMLVCGTAMLASAIK